jgi:predicted DCC family thiol-disulfide oxidoreductase YuxK
MLLEGGRVYARSDAVLRIARNLTAPWPATVVFLVLPRFLRDALYRFLAHHRYRWFGKTDECRLPTAELRTRFLA